MEGSGGLELALGGVIDGGAQGGAAGVLGWIGKGATEANLELDEPLPVGAPVAKKRSVIAGEKGTSRSTSPAATSLCHGREHVLGRDETVAHALATPIPARRSTAMNRDRAYPPFPQNTLSENLKLL